MESLLVYCANFFCSASKDTPFVSGTLVKIQTNCNAIITVKKANIGHGLSPKIPDFSSKNRGVIRVIIAAKIQCVPVPQDCPYDLILLGKIYKPINK